jgi:hypothetical protein
MKGKRMQIIDIGEYKTKRDLLRNLKQGPTQFVASQLITPIQKEMLRDLDDYKEYMRRLLVNDIANYLVDKGAALFTETEIPYDPERPTEPRGTRTEMRVSICLFVSAQCLERIAAEK